MGFWKLSPDDEERKRLKAAARDAEVQRQELDLKLLEHGGIPTLARQRLAELGKQSDVDSLFTSNLSPGELALLRSQQYKARGLVSGSAMFHVGKLFVAAASDCEIANLSGAYNDATTLAVNRMKQELELIGGHGVLGVRFNIARHEWAEQTIEVQVLGTAVEGPSRPAKPWLSDLCAQEWFALRRAGYDPVGLVWGHCAWWLYTSLSDEIQERSWNNVEMSHWSDGLSNARHLAMNKIIAKTRELGGNGVVGVNIQRRLDRMRLTGTTAAASERLHHNILLTIIGTAIRASGSSPQRAGQTVNVLSLLDGRLKPVVMKQQADFSVQDD